MTHVVRQQAFQRISGPPRQIEKSFFGMAALNWPRTTADVPAFASSIGSVTNFGDSLTFWGSMHTAPNTIDWTTLDNFVANARAAGVQDGIYCLNGTPTFLAGASSGIQGPHGMLGEGAYPTDLGQLTYFCQQFAIRNNAVWGHFFSLVSAGNEMDYREIASTGYFWWGTRAQFVDFSWTVKAAFNAADPTMRIGSPGMFEAFEQNYGMDQVINQPGTVNPTRTGKDCFEWACTHPYFAGPTSIQAQSYGDLTNARTLGTNVVRDFLGRNGKTVAGVIASEWGFGPGDGFAPYIAFLAQTPAYRASFMERLFMCGFMYGMSGIYPWYYGAGSPSGQWQTDTNGVVLGYTNASANMTGKTWAGTGGYDTVTGQVTMDFTSGSSRVV